MKITTFLILAGVSMAPLLASADTIAYTGFNTPTGNLDGTGGTGDVGFTGSWTSDSGNNNGTPANSVVAGSLSYSNLLTTGNSATITAEENGFGGGSLRMLSTPQSGTVWVSFLYQSLVATTSDNAFNGLTLLDAGSGNTNGGLAFGQAYDGTTVVAFGDKLSGGTPDSGMSSLNLSFIAANIDLADGTATWYLNPTGLGSGSAPTGADYTGTLTFGSFTLDGIGLRGNAPADFDEVRLGTTWDDVSPIMAVPEPSSVALILGGLGALLLIGRNRRSTVSI